MANLSAKVALGESVGISVTRLDGSVETDGNPRAFAGIKPSKFLLDVLGKLLDPNRPRPARLPSGESGGTIGNP
jgi:hypothetical protein